jgi:hypothetical protein
MPREGMGPGGPNHPGGPMPPRDPAYQPPPGPAQGRGPDRGAGRHAGGPGYGAAGGRRPAAPGHAEIPGRVGTPRFPGAPGPAGPAEAGPAEAGPFDGGYAYVIRASDSPVRPAAPARPPSVGRPAGPARSSDPIRSQASVRPAGEPPADVYLYRDTDGQPDDPAAAQVPAENDAAYWYDLPGASPKGPAGPESGGGAGGDAPPHVLQETRGPFEPLVSSADPPGTAPRFSADAAGLGTAGPGAAEPVAPDVARPDEAPGNDGQPDTAYAHARKLEQIKDLYLTAEAIGEANVDKHFDQLLAQQRELIGEYFKHSSATRPTAAGSPADAAAESADQAEADPAALRDPGPPVGGPAGAPEGARVAADQPRTW